METKLVPGFHATYISSILQDVLLVGADDRGVLDGAVPGHLPPALLPHHVRLQARSQNHLPRLGRQFNRYLAFFSEQYPGSFIQSMVIG